MRVDDRLADLYSVDVLQDIWAWANNNWDTIGALTLQHLRIILVANGAGVVVGVLLGIFISGRGRERLADLILYLTGMLITIPSLAMYGILMAILGAMGLSRIGFVPAVVALALYGLLPIVRNTYTAIVEVSPAIIDAGRGMGMSERQLLTKIKLPLAVPVIMAGVRQAVVMNVGIAAIAAWIGAGGLGQLMFRGIQEPGRMGSILVVVGSISVAVLALASDFVLGALEYLATPRGLRGGARSS